MGRRSRDMLLPKTLPWAQNREFSHQMGVSPGGVKGWHHSLHSPFPGIFSGRWSPKISGLENQQDWHPRVPKCIGNWESLLKRLTCSFTHSKTQQNNNSSKSAQSICKGGSCVNLQASAGGEGTEEMFHRGRGTGYMPLLHFLPNLQAIMAHCWIMAIAVLLGSGGWVQMVAIFICSLAKVCECRRWWHSTVPWLKLGNSSNHGLSQPRANWILLCPLGCGEQTVVAFFHSWPKAHMHAFSCCIAEAYGCTQSRYFPSAFLKQESKPILSS